MIIAYPVGLSSFMARRASKVMALALGESRNAVHGRGQANPKGAAVVSRSRVAALAKDCCHSLRTAPCRETPQQRWIRNYHVDEALVPARFLVCRVATACSGSSGQGCLGYRTFISRFTSS